MKRVLKSLPFLVCLFLSQTKIIASSHREAPLISADPDADNTDVYAFRSPCDSSKVVLIANYIPFQHPAGGPNWYHFGQNIRYEIHVKNKTTTTIDDITYRFTFTNVLQDSSTFFNIRLGQENLKSTYLLEKSINGGTFSTIVAAGKVPPNNIGPRSIETTVGLNTTYDALINSSIMMATGGGGEKVFAGPADDPFFVDLGGAFDLGGFRTAGRDGLAKQNIHSICIEVPISSLQKDGKTTAQATSILDGDFVIGVWASASRPQIKTLNSDGTEPAATGSWVQVSRLGMPLLNEAINPVGEKDRWNAGNPYNTNNELSFASYFKNPELGLYMDDKRFGGAVPGLSKLRIQTKSLATTADPKGFDFQNDSIGLYKLKGNAALNGTALAPGSGGAGQGYGDILLPDNHSPRSVDILPIFYTGVPNLAPYQLATGKPQGSPLSVGKPFINNFLPTLGDMLRLNMAVPVTDRSSADFSSLGLVKAAVLGLTDSRFNGSAALQNIPNMDGFPNGRRLEDDVTTIELQAVGGVVLAAIGLWYDDYNVSMTGANPVTTQLGNVLGFQAGVTKNDTTLKACFPYVQSPWRGFTGPQYNGPSPALPISFLDFTAAKLNKSVKLNWKVENDKNSVRYDVEYSLGRGVFTKIGSVNASVGSGTKMYEFVHTNPALSQGNYYRIKEVAADGTSTYTTLRLVTFENKTLLTIAPNPATDFVKVYSSSQESIMVNVYDNSGKRVLSKTITNGTGELDLRALPSGVYTAVANEKDKKAESIKIVKQ